MSGNFTSTSDDDDLFEPVYTAFFRTGIWECVVAAIGAPANLLVMSIAISLITRTSRRRRGQKSYNQYYVLSMTVADFLFTSIHAPLYGTMYAFQLDYSFPVCHFLYIATHTSTVSSSLSLLCLNIDKFVAIHKPLHHSLIMNKKTTLRLLALCWIVSASWAVLLTEGPLMSMPIPCKATLEHEVAYYTFTVVFFVLPILLSFLIAVYVALVTGRRSSMVSRDESAHSQTARAEDTNNTKELVCQRHWTRERRRTNLDKYKSHAKTLTFVFCTTVWSTITSIPVRILRDSWVPMGAPMTLHLLKCLYFQYRTSFVLQIYQISSIELSMFLFGLMAANALGNPFITLTTQRQYRSRLSKCLSRIRKH